MKFLIKVIIILISVSIAQYTYATWEEWWAESVIYVTEKIPGVWAKCVKKWDDWSYSESTEEEWCDKYEVAVKRDFWSVTDIIKWIIKYFTLLAYLLWVLFIVLNWIMISISWIDSWIKETAKKRIIQTILWLIILSLSWLILNIVAPWIFS